MKKQIEKNLDYTLATFAIERLTPSKDAIRLCRDTAKRKVSIDYAVQTMKDKYRVSGIK